jgi:hypothetical protein
LAEGLSESFIRYVWPRQLHSRFSSGSEGGAEEAERDETADAAGLVAEGAVAASIVVLGGSVVEEGPGVELPNIFARRLVNIPITTHGTLCLTKLRTASSTVCIAPKSLKIWKRRLAAEYFCMMPRKLMKPGALDFDTDVVVCIGLSFEQELVLLLFASDHCRKSAQRAPLSRPVTKCLRAPMFTSMRYPFGRIVDYPFDGIDVTRIKSLDRVMLHDGNAFSSRPIGGDEETVNAVTHVYKYHYLL